MIWKSVHFTPLCVVTFLTQNKQNYAENKNFSECCKYEEVTNTNITKDW